MILMLVVVLPILAAVMAAVHASFTEPSLPISGQLFQKGLERGFFLTGQGLEQLVLLQFGVAHEASAPVEQAGQPSHLPVAAAVAVIMVMPSFRYAEVFAPFAALKGVHGAVVVALGAGLLPIVFHRMIHQNRLSFKIVVVRHLATILPQLMPDVKKNIYVP